MVFCVCVCVCMCVCVCVRVFDVMLPEFTTIIIHLPQKRDQDMSQEEIEA